MEETNKTAALEAILFTVGESVSIADLAKKLKIEENECLALIADYRNSLANRPESGLVLAGDNQKFRLATKPELASFIEDLMKEEFRENLTPAALETLAIIAYLGPLPRANIDQIRGVNSSFILRNLLVRGLIERPAEERRAGHAYRQAGGYVYRVSADFLAHLGLAAAADLPEFEKFKRTLERFDLESKPDEESIIENSVKES